jgi:hypothetical protein
MVPEAAQSLGWHARTDLWNVALQMRANEILCHRRLRFSYLARSGENQRGHFVEQAIRCGGGASRDRPHHCRNDMLRTHLQ